MQKARRGFTLRADVARLAMRIERRLWNSHIEYEEAVNYWYTHGEGKTKRYTYPTCEHGTSRWTDYDNICGPCEDGLFLSNGIHRRRYALSEAKERIEKADRLLITATDMTKERIAFDAKKFYQMVANCLNENVPF